MTRWLTRFAVMAAILLAVATIARGYALISSSSGALRWPDGTVIMQLQLGSGSGTLIDGSTSWNDVAEAGLAIWNSYVSRLAFRVVRNSTAATGDNNGVNNIVFSDTIYGRSFGTNTLAVTTVWYRAPATRVEADVLFNTKWSWDSYRGARRSGLIDFRRVAIHEEGHVLGLDHPDDYGQHVTAIMNAFVSDTDNVTSDDIAGAQALYGAAGLLIPGAPSGLTTSVSGSSIVLSWSAPTSGGAPTGYVIEAGSSSGLANLANLSTGTTTTTFSTSGVNSGAYYVRIRATNSAGTSSPSNEALLIVGGGCSAPPAAPSGLHVASNGGGTVVLSWNAAVGATSYIVEAGSVPGATNLANSDLGSSGTSLIATSVGRGTYYVRIRGKNACGTGAASNEIVVTVQ